MKGLFYKKIFLTFIKITDSKNNSGVTEVFGENNFGKSSYFAMGGKNTIGNSDDINSDEFTIQGAVCFGKPSLSEDQRNKIFRAMENNGIDIHQKWGNLTKETKEKIKKILEELGE